MSSTTQHAKTFNLRTFEMTESILDCPGPDCVLIKVEKVLLHPDGIFEGIGTVVQCGVKSRRLQDKLVVFIKTGQEYAKILTEYIICPSKACIIYKSSEFYLYNSLTAIMIIQTILAKKHSKAVHMSKDYVLNGILLKLASYHNITLVNIVDEPVEDIINPLNPTVIVFGTTENDSSCFNLLPENSEFIVYRNSEFIDDINPSELIFRGKTIKGLDFARWFNGLFITQRVAHLNFISNNQDIFHENVEIIESKDLESELYLYYIRKVIEIPKFFEDISENYIKPVKYDDNQYDPEENKQDTRDIRSSSDQKSEGYENEKEDFERTDSGKDEAKSNPQQNENEENPEESKRDKNQEDSNQDDLNKEDSNQDDLNKEDSNPDDLNKEDSNPDDWNKEDSNQDDLDKEDQNDESKKSEIKDTKSAEEDEW
jgi:hypothetical protein